MERYTIQQRLLIVKAYYESNGSIVGTERRLRAVFGRNLAPAKRTIQRLMAKFEESGSVCDTKLPIRQRVRRSVENIDIVRESVAADNTISIRHRAQQLNISKTTLHRILTKDLHLHPYKIQLTQELKPRDHARRREFSDWLLGNVAVDADFWTKLIFSDEAHFQLNGFVNKQNCRIWGAENPRVIQEKPMHPPRVTVWCALWAGGVIGPFFFENQAGDAVTVNGERYREMLNNYFFHQINNLDLADMWFQQDGATCHTADETLNLLATRFPGRIISNRAEVNWPPRSCDMTPLDFFLWGYVKGKVYANNPATIQQLKENIRGVIAEIEPELCRKVMENFVKRVDICQRSRGGHLEDIVFHV